MFRDDDIARTERSMALITEIAELERQKVIQAASDQRLDAARRELAALQSPAAAEPQPPGVIAHLLVFGATAAAAFVAYTLLS